MKAAPFNSESDLRRWLRVRFHDRLFWVEPSAGSTIGMPDAILVHEGNAIFIEAKLGEVSRKNKSITFSVRPEQKVVLKRMVHLNLSVLGLIAVKGTPELYASPVNDAFLEGRIELKDREGANRTLFRMPPGRASDPGGKVELATLLGALPEPDQGISGT